MPFRLPCSSCFKSHNGATPPLETWSAQFVREVIRDGFYTAFKNNVQTIAEFAETQETDIPKHIEKWLRADESLRDYLTAAVPLPKPRVQKDRKPDASIPGVVERDGRSVKVYNNELFNNWGDTVENVPKFTFVPKTKVGVCNIVKFARREKLRVRVSGARHSWSDVYGASGEVLISMLELDAATARGRFSFPDSNPQDNELERIRFEGEFTAEDGTQHARVRLGAATTSDHFRKWALDTQGGNWAWMIRALPVLTSITSAGWTQVICHGSGIRHKTVSDLVLEVVIVNCFGELQVISDQQLLKAVSGGFGLLGVVVEQVFILDPLKIADFFPRKVPTVLGVPPVRREDVPKNDDFDVAEVTDAQLREATETFQEDFHKFYSEWFWFPFQSEVWINTWDTSPVTQDRPVYPDKKEIKLQRLQIALARIFEVTFLKYLPAKKQAELTGFAALKFLPSGELLRTGVPDALHFQRGIHMLPVRDCEMEIEIPVRADGSSDFSICQKAWWMAIQAVYEVLPSAPMRTTLEMRVMGGSDVTMSTQRGNNFGTCSIEVITNSLVDDEEWARFIENVTDRWASLTNPLTGRSLRVRPHFAKEWPRRIGGLRIEHYLRQEYRKEIPEFKVLLMKTAEMGGYSLENAFGMFGNDTILKFLGAK